ncbi:MAG: transglutaminase domain-containing protein, partial [bacterium]|nr:transglutaminase domain-containing protein [bacterium]
MDAVSILREIRAGRTQGFCAQYNYIFVQAVQSFGIKARYITIHLHEVTEVWITELGKWVCFDPYYVAYSMNANKQPLSAYEIYKSVKETTPVIAETQKPIEDTGYYFKRFKTFAVWMKNNHIFSPINFNDIDYYKVYFYEQLDELSTSTILNRFITSSVTDLYGNPPN